MSDENNEVVSTESRRSADKPRGRAGFVFLLLVMPVALIALGWFSWQQQQTLAAMQVDYQNLAATASQLTGLQQTQGEFTSRQQQLEQGVQLLTSSQQQSQGALQQQLQVALNSLNDQSGRLALMDQELATLRASVANVGAGALRTQVLTEANGLLRLAEQRLQLAHDVDSAQHLVRTIDSLLAQIGDNDINAVRAQLANDLAALQAVQKADTGAIYLKLGEAITQLNNLTAVSDSAVEDMKVTPGASTTPVDAGWLDQTMNFLGQYFVITQRDEAITPLLSPQQVWFVRKSVELQLQQARFAALSGDANVFKVALVEAQSMIGASLQGTNKDALLATLKSLENSAVQTQVPTLAATMTALQALQTAAAGRAP